MVITLFLILKTGTQNWTPYISNVSAPVLADHVDTQEKVVSGLEHRKLVILRH